MAETIAELRELSDEEIIEKHDILAKQTQVGTQHYLQELYRRDQKHVSDDMLKYTRQIRVLTIVITIATIINVVLFAF